MKSSENKVLCADVWMPQFFTLSLSQYLSRTDVVLWYWLCSCSFHFCNLEICSCEKAALQVLMSSVWLSFHYQVKIQNTEAWKFLDLAAMISRKVLCFSERLQFYNRRFANNPICQELNFYQIITVSSIWVRYILESVGSSSKYDLLLKTALFVTHCV